MEKYEKLKKALKKAIDAANLEQIKDDGTCNFDSPVLFYKNMGYSEQKAIEAIKAVGLDAWTISGRRWKGCLVLGGMTRGQASCRTAMVEAFVKSMKESGIKCGIYYQMD